MFREHKINIFPDRWVELVLWSETGQHPFASEQQKVDVFYRMLNNLVYFNAYLNQIFTTWNKIFVPNIYPVDLANVELYLRDIRY